MKSVFPRLGLGLALALGACASLDSRSSPALRVASDLDNVPFAGIADGRPFGRDVAMMEELAARLGRDLEWRRLPFDRLLDALEAGEVDVVCATLGVTPERAERVRFTRPYYRTSLGVVARPDAGEPRTLADLAGRRVFASAGTTSERAVRRQLPDSLGVFVPEGGDDLERWLASGEIDAAVMDGPACDAMVARSRGALVRLGEDLGAEDYALAVGRGRAALAARLDAALEELERRGRLRALDAEYGLAPSESADSAADSAAIRATIDELYAAFGFDAGGEPDWSAQRRLFLEGASFVAPIRPGAAPVGVDAETFLGEFREFVRTGPYASTGFHERVLGVRVDVFGGVAQAFVAFEGFRPDEGEALTRGLDGLQLVHDGTCWRLASFTTQYETADLRLPPRFRSR